MSVSAISPLVIKVGGALLDSQQHLTKLFAVIAQVQQSRPVLLVHGGGSLVEQWLTALNLPSSKIDGLRVTPREQIPFVVGALAGAANKQLVAQAKINQINAVGLSLADGDIAISQALAAKFGCVGASQGGSGELLKLLITQHYVPIISSIGCDEQGQLLNVNADQAAVAVAQSIGAELLLLSDVPGVLDAKRELIPALNAENIQQLIAQNVILDGMAVKVNAALATANLIGKPVIIAGWKSPEKLAELSQVEAVGTTIYPQTSI
ncbi:acetylglutamate kinase [Neptunicella sp. SCSIO 80796]|uniref:acetylglutamate kinase n=1 Tax=Neptunicella plasticusilytica TaxID=3117012 RepID=UPI003A4D768D